MNCNTPSKHIFSDWLDLDGNALLTFSFYTRQSMNGATTGYYKLQMQSNMHSVTGALSRTFCSRVV